MTKTDVLVRFTLRHLDRLSGSFDGIMQSGDEVAVHKFRVASRRLNEPLEILAPIVGRKKVNAVQKSLRRARKRLNLTRDLDVLMASLSKAATLMEGHDREISRLAEMLGERRAMEIREARRALLRLRPSKIVKKIEALSESLDRNAPADQESRIAARCEKRWGEKTEAMLKIAPGDDREIDLHEVRVALKGLRYLTELHDRLEDQDSEPLLDTFAAMQDRLGGWNDSMVAARFVSDMATTTESLASDPRFAAFLLAYASVRAKLVAAEHRECLRMWPRLEQAVRAAVHPDEAIKATVAAEPDAEPRPPTGTTKREATQAAG